MKVNYPSDWKGQIYIPSINWILMAGCLLVVLHFEKSTNMEAAYGMAIIVNMLMTSPSGILLSHQITQFYTSIYRNRLDDFD